MNRLAGTKVVVVNRVSLQIGSLNMLIQAGWGSRESAMHAWSDVESVHASLASYRLDSWG